jgi:hypothetical protein
MGQPSRRRAFVHGSSRCRSSTRFIETLEPRSLLSVATFAPAVRFDLAPFTRSFVTADFNNDGRPDIAAVNTADNAVTTLLNDGNGAFTRAPRLGVNLPRAIAAADFNHDGLVDLAVSTTDGTNPLLDVFSGLGNGTFATPPAHYRMISGASYMIATDLNGDGFADIVTVNRNRIGVWLNLGNGTFGAPSYYDVGGERPTFVAAADLNNDGVPDLIVARGRRGSVTVLLGNRTAPGTFGPPTIFPAGVNPLGLAVGDFNHDGNQDVAVVGSGFRAAAVSVLLGNGDGTLRPRGFYNGPNFSDVIASADFSGDGNLDLVVGSFVSSLRLYPGNGDGTFGPPVTLSGAQYTEFLQIADFNGDGKPDIAATPGFLKILINTTGTVPTPTPSPQDQTIGAGAKSSFTFTAPDGTQSTISLTGPGAATLHFVAGSSAAHPDGRSLASIAATGTTAATTLTIQNHAGSHTITVGSITTDGAFKAINLPSTNLTGTLSVPGGAQSVSLLSANNGSITLGGASDSVTTLMLGQSNNEAISSPGTFDRVQVQLDAGIKLTATAVATMSVGGALHDSVLTLTAPAVNGAFALRSLTAQKGMINTTIHSAGSIGTVNSMFVINSSVYAGVGPLPPGQGLPASASDFAAPAQIGSVSLGRSPRLPSFSNSVIAASSLGNLNLGTIPTSNGGTPFGLAARSVASVAGTDLTTHRDFRLTKLTSPQNLHDFTIRLLT